MIVRTSFSTLERRKIIVLKYKYCYIITIDHGTLRVEDGIKDIYYYYLENVL